MFLSYEHAEPFLIVFTCSFYIINLLTIYIYFFYKQSSFKTSSHLIRSTCLSSVHTFGAKLWIKKQKTVKRWEMRYKINKLSFFFFLLASSSDQRVLISSTNTHRNVPFLQFIFTVLTSDHAGIENNKK